MVNIIDFITEVIRVDFIIRFGLYSILYFVLGCFFENNKSLIYFDKSAIWVIKILGITFGVLWLIGLLLPYYQFENELDKIAYKQRITGYGAIARKSITL